MTFVISSRAAAALAAFALFFGALSPCQPPELRALAETLSFATADAQEIMNPLCPCGCEKKRGSAAYFGIDETILDNTAAIADWPPPRPPAVRLARFFHVLRSPPAPVPRA